MVRIIDGLRVARTAQAAVEASLLSSPASARKSSRISLVDLPMICFGGDQDSPAAETVRRILEHVKDVTAVT